MAIPAGVELGAEAAMMLGGAAFKTYAQTESGGAQVNALRLKQTQERLGAVTQATQQLNQVQRIVSAQNARVGASGVTQGGSLSAVESDTFNQAAADLKTQDINAQLKQAALQQDIENTQDESRFNIIGNLFDVGTEFFRNP